MDRHSGVPDEAGASSPPRRVRWRGPTLVALAMVAAFGVGVLIASRTELFPPQVQGAFAHAPDSPDDPAATQSGPLDWDATMTSRTSQRYSAGSCVTVWRSSMRIVAESDGLVHGRGRARLAGEARCPFPMSQPQIRGYEFDVGGLLDPRDGFRLSIERAEPTRGIFDYGGFASIAASGSALEAPLTGIDRARGQSAVRTRTSVGKVVTSRTVIRLRCRECGTP